ncbi:MAG: CoA transferase, partial [Phototrophicales bacterium]
HDQHVEARGLIHEISLHENDTLRFVGPAAKLMGTPAQVKRPPPTLGEHTDEILREVLQLDDATITRYHDEGVV